jgi:hypothetical protein
MVLIHAIIVDAVVDRLLRARAIRLTNWLHRRRVIITIVVSAAVSVVLLSTYAWHIARLSVCVCVRLVRSTKDQTPPASSLSITEAIVRGAGPSGTIIQDLPRLVNTVCHTMADRGPGGYVVVLVVLLSLLKIT